MRAIRTEIASEFKVMNYNLSQSELKDEVMYNRCTGLFIRFNGMVAGGFSHSSGYGRVSIKGKSYYLHRLAFLYVDGEMPEFVDHLNGDVSDNSWGNLRKCTRAENNRNTKLSKNNSSGFKGVDWSKPMNKWRSRMYIDGKEVTLGYFSDINLANDLVVKERDNHYKEFNCNDR